MRNAQRKGQDLHSYTVIACVCLGPFFSSARTAWLLQYQASDETAVSSTFAAGARWKRWHCRSRAPHKQLRPIKNTPQNVPWWKSFDVTGGGGGFFVRGDTPSNRSAWYSWGAHVAETYAHSSTTPYTKFKVDQTVAPVANAPPPQVETAKSGRSTSLSSLCLQRRTRGKKSSSSSTREGRASPPRE